jgi:hypothetical protein
MIRIVFTYVLPLVLPTALYFLWAWWDGRRRRAGDAAAPGRTTPWVWLILAGVVLAMGILIYTALGRGAPAGSRIIAPRLQDGQVVPAQIE